MVTGLEVETLSYGRIGELGVRDALAGDLDLVRVQPDPTGSHTARVVLTAAAEERLGGPAWYSYDVAAQLVGPLYPLYREPPRHSVEVGPVDHSAALSRTPRQQQPALSPRKCRGVTDGAAGRQLRSRGG